MGYQRPLIKLTFDESTGDMAGFEATLRRLSIGDMRNATALATMADNATEEQVAERLERVISVVAKGLVSWNLEDENGVPVPATHAGVEAQDIGLLRDLVNQWIESMTAVSRPLSKPSKDGAQFPEGLTLPMEELPILNPTN